MEKLGKEREMWIKERRMLGEERERWTEEREKILEEDRDRLLQKVRESL